MELKRRKFQGVLNILSFNRHFYVFGCIALVMIIGSHVLFPWSYILFVITIIGFTYGLIMPLLVSAFVYDLSSYYDFKWLKTPNSEDLENALILNINAGFDETSFILKDLFPKADLRVFDFYNLEQHTEPAIVRARKVSMVYPNTQQIDSNQIPLSENSVDAIFLLSAAHEIRQNDEKVQFLKECYRVCKPTGRIIMVEHLRDVPNFFAFTIGFTHFFSRKTWTTVFKKAGFSTFEETKFTPFMSIFSFKP